MQIDQRLVHACIAHDQSAQRQLYDELMPYLAAVCRRYLYDTNDVQDALQETFINLFRGIEGYDENKAAFKTWAVRITINSSLRYNERMNKMDTVEFVNDVHSTFNTPAVLRKLNDDEAMAFLKKMPSDHFAVFNMYVVDGYSHKEIAEALGIDESLSRKRLSRARQWISRRRSETTMSIVAEERRG